MQGQANRSSALSYLAVAFLALLAILFCARDCFAAQKTFVAYPFTVNAPNNFKYLSKAIPSTLVSRLNGAALKGAPGSAKVSNEAEARKALGQARADYAVWGNVNVVGKDCVVEISSLDKKGKVWTKSASSPVSDLMASVNGLSASLAAEAMGEPIAARPGFMSPGRKSKSSGSDIIVNETGQNQAYLNPQFRYQGAGAADGSRMTSQRLKEGMVDMAVGDFNGDGKTEIAFLGEHKLVIYKWEPGGKLKSLGEINVAKTNQNYSMRAMDLNKDGAQDLVVATYNDSDNRPLSYFYSFKGNKFRELSPRVPYFASVIRMPPSFAPMLVGQGWDSMKLFAPGIHQMVKNGDKYALGSRIKMPTGANVFNVAWIPASKASGGDMLIMLADNERIKLYQGSMEKPIHTTMEQFSGSSVGMDFYKGMPGLAVDKTKQLAAKYYAPLRMIAADIGNTGEQVVLLNKPISTASQFFDRYRYFPQGEIHALYWDGVGLGLKWKTRRIRGSVAEIDLGDVNNDGILDLVVGVNTSPELGIGSRQSMITAYPLDTNQMDPNAPVDMSDFESRGR